MIGGLGYIDDGDQDGADMLGFLNGILAAPSGGFPSAVLSAAAAAKSALAATQVYFSRTSSTDSRVSCRRQLRWSLGLGFVHLGITAPGLQ